jgi:hypothetical protein
MHLSEAFARNFAVCILTLEADEDPSWTMAKRTAIDHIKLQTPTILYIIYIFNTYHSKSLHACFYII